MVLKSDLGAGASDIFTKVGTSVAAGGVSSSAKYMSFRQGLGGTEFEEGYIQTQYNLTGSTMGIKLVCPGSTAASIALWNSMMTPAKVELTAGAASIIMDTVGWAPPPDNGIKLAYTGSEIKIQPNILAFGAGSTAQIDSNGFSFSSALRPNNLAGTAGQILQSNGAGASPTWVNSGGGATWGSITGTLSSQTDLNNALYSGTDSSGTPGAATINKPNGISAVALGATTCVITNSLVTTGSHIVCSFMTDTGAMRFWVVPAAGSFTVTLSSAASAIGIFSWSVKTLV